MASRVLNGCMSPPSLAAVERGLDAMVARDEGGVHLFHRGAAGVRRPSATVAGARASAKAILRGPRSPRTARAAAPRAQRRRAASPRWRKVSVKSARAWLHAADSSDWISAMSSSRTDDRPSFARMRCWNCEIELHREGLDLRGDPFDGGGFIAAARAAAASRRSARDSIARSRAGCHTHIGRGGRSS